MVSFRALLGEPHIDSFRAVEAARAEAEGAGGGRSPSECYETALNYVPDHAASHVGLASTLLRRAKPKRALEHVGTATVSAEPSALVNRAVMMHELGDDEAARRDLEHALTLLPDSVFAAYDFAQLQMMTGEWCAPLASLQKLGALRPAHVNTAAAMVDGSVGSERAAIDAHLGPLLQACSKWQNVLRIALIDMKQSVRLLQPRLSHDRASSDAAFVPLVPEGAEGTGLSAAQLAQLEAVLEATEKNATRNSTLPPGKPRAGRGGAEANAPAASSPATQLPLELASQV